MSYLETTTALSSTDGVEVKSWPEIVVKFAVMPVLSTLGTVNNLLVVGVFALTRLTDGISVAFFAQGILDFFYNVIMLYRAIVGIIIYYRLSDELVYKSNYLIDITNPIQLCLFDMTMVCTVFISVQRCLCVTMPFKYRQMMGSRRAVLIVLTLCIIIFACYVPLWFDLEVIIEWDPTINSTVLRYPRRGILSPFFISVMTGIMGTGLSFCSFIILLVCMALLIVVLNQSAKFRHSRSKSTRGQEDRAFLFSQAEKKLVICVLLLCCSFLICNFPEMVITCIRSTGVTRETYLIKVFTPVSDVLHAIITSANFFIYYTTNTKFKATIEAMKKGWKKLPEDRSTTSTRAGGVHANEGAEIPVN